MPPSWGTGRGEHLAQASLLSPTHKKSHTNHAVPAQIVTLSSQQDPVKHSGFFLTLCFYAKKNIFLFTSVLPFSWSTRRYEAREELLLRNALSVFPHQAVPLAFKQVQDMEVVSLRGTGHPALVMSVSGVFPQLLAGSCDVFIPSRHPLR